MRQLYALTLAVSLATLLAAGGCSKDKSIDQPAKLTPLTPTLRAERIWAASVDDKKAAVLRLGLGLSVADNRVYAAGHRGDVVAFDLASGRTLWRAHTRAPLSGGTAANARLVLAGSSDGQFFAFNPASGVTLWKVRLNGEVLAPAAISERLIAVRTVDGKLHALSPADGHELWSQDQPVPRLSLRGTARPVIAGDLVLCGFDNGKVLAANMNDGSVQWEATITPPHGRTELERLADIDSAVGVSGQDVYAVGFQ
ncbi:MAG TPA: PQQ-binding-like beta-propeller repeat protein [Steroidobacteraceae bacterium]|nr:PQQ-binding-like beta-propeller repeat protein [Steroidobacteraceae bacterium]